MSNESITNQRSSVPSLPPLRRVLPVLVVQVLVAMAIAGAFAGLYIGLQKAPVPHHLPVAVVGAQLADAASTALGDSADVRPVDSAAAARALVRSHDVVAALVPAAGGSTLAVAGADGRSATGAATAMLSGVARAGGVPVTRTQDLVPLVTGDGQGIAGFYLVFGTTLAAFVLAQIMNSLGTLAGLRVRVAVTVIGSIAAAVVVAVIAGPVAGAVPAAPRCRRRRAGAARGGRLAVDPGHHRPPRPDGRRRVHARVHHPRQRDQRRDGEHTPPAAVPVRRRWRTAARSGVRGGDGGQLLRRRRRRPRTPDARPVDHRSRDRVVRRRRPSPCRPA
ncbi:hypothetical protein [Curtobacterium sp. MCJR17_043]|uniref:hypothetical protein n=1 Tax=Curtobacterium sp. MCJR17_043 TaxID=2175660 RepID=UPI0024DFFCE0|nr:hypothetical protein [Curtobacterium sp. MCJR17_043]WIB34829.1 hypothetical protein DEJ15_09630 [Curtobacterium sp. MCJR17_043]